GQTTIAVRDTAIPPFYREADLTCSESHVVARAAPVPRVCHSSLRVLFEHETFGDQFFRCFPDRFGIRLGTPIPGHYRWPRIARLHPLVFGIRKGNIAARDADHSAVPVLPATQAPARVRTKRRLHHRRTDPGAIVAI